MHALSLPLHLRLGARSDPIRQRIRWITDLHRRATHADARSRALALAAASAGLQELLLTLALAGPEEPLPEANSSRVETAVRTLVEIVETRLKEPLSVPNLAEEAGLSQNYLAQAFRHRYGLTMPNFILRRRVELACYLLTVSRGDGHANRPGGRSARRAAFQQAVPAAGGGQPLRLPGAGTEEAGGRNAEVTGGGCGLRKGTITAFLPTRQRG